MSESVPAGWSQATISSFGKVVTGSTPTQKQVSIGMAIFHLFHLLILMVQFL